MSELMAVWHPRHDRAHVDALMRAGGIPHVVTRADGVRIDATSTFERELMAIIARPFQTRYPMARFREFIPVSAEAGAGARTVTHRLWDMVGDAKVVGPEGDDVPLVDVTGSETSSPIVSLGTGYRVTFQDLREAILTGRSIDTMRASAARRIMELRADRLAALGDSTIGLVGLLKHASVPSVSPANGTWTPGVSTAAEMIEDCVKLLNSVPIATQETSSPNRLILGTDEHHILATTMMGSGSTESALSSLKKLWREKTGEELIVAGWTRADLANSTNNGPRAMAYRYGEDLWINVPMEYTTYAPQIDGFAMKVLSEMRIGSFDTPFPLSAGYMDGL